jgi:hypothetical protein
MQRTSEADARVSHRLAWFGAVQGMSFLAVVMFAATNVLVSGVLICAGIAMSAVAILATCCKGSMPKPTHLAFAIFWAAVGVVYVTCT